MPIDLLADDEPTNGPIDLLADDDYSSSGYESSGSTYPKQGFFKNLLDYEKGGAVGMAQGIGDTGVSILNFPSSIYEHFTGKQPYHVPHPSLRGYYPESVAGKVGGGIGEFSGGLAVPGGISFKIFKALNNPITRILGGIAGGGFMGAASNENDRLGSALTGALVGGAIPAGVSVVQGIKKVGSKIRQPYRDLEKIKEYEKKLNESLQGTKKSASESDIQVKQYLQKEYEDLGLEKSELEKKLIDQFPINSKAETRQMLAQETKAAKEDLEKSFNDRYGRFSKTHGQTPIHSPLDFDDFLKQTEGLKGLSAKIKSIRKNPSEKIIKYESSTGDIHEIKTPGYNATTDDYISFMRELRDAAHDAKHAAKNATYGEKMDLLHTSNALKKLQQEVESKIEYSIGKKNFEPFKKIQEDYSKTIGALKDESSLRNAASSKARISDSILSDLLQPANATLKEYLLKRPKYQEALTSHILQDSKHPVAKVAELNPAKIDEDVYKMLTDSQRVAHHEVSIHALKGKKLDELSKVIKDPKVMTMAQEAEARKFSPQVNEYLDRVAQTKNVTKEMEQEAQNLGISKAELEKQIAFRRNIMAMIAAGSAIGAVPEFAKKMISAF